MGTKLSSVSRLTSGSCRGTEGTHPSVSVKHIACEVRIYTRITSLLGSVWDR